MKSTPYKPCQLTKTWLKLTIKTLLTCVESFTFYESQPLYDILLLLNYLPPEYEFVIIKCFRVYAAMNQDRDLLMELKLVL